MHPFRRLTREKRKLLLIGLLVLSVAALTLLETYLQGTPLTSRFVTNNIVVFAVVNLNILLLLVLVLLVLRNLTKLYFEHRMKIPGSRFKTKLFVAFTLLSILPALVVFAVSLDLIHKSIRAWFENRVEQVLKGTTEVAADHYRALGEGNLYFGRRIVRGIAGERLLEEGKPASALTSFLSASQRQYNLAALAVYDVELRRVAEATAPAAPPEALADTARRSLREALRGNESVLVEASGPGDLVRALVPVPPVGGDGPPLGVLVVSAHVPRSIARRARDITNAYEQYRQSKILKSPIRVSYQMALGVVTLLVIFSATWFAFSLSRFITVPIQHLAEGTRRVSEGDLDFRIEQSADDELGMLIDSFNRMTRDLKANKASLEAAYRRLERSNLELDAGKRYIETVLDSVAAGVISLDARGRLTTVNKAARAMLGLGEGARARLPFAEVFAGAGFDGIRRCIAELQGGAVHRLERKVDLVVDGSPANLLVVGSNLLDERATITGTVVVLENLTELIAAQRIAAWREVARRIAHEIKNPLTPIKLSAQRVRRKFFQKSPDFEPVFDDATRLIIEQVDELKRLVDEFSRFARMPAGRPVPTDVAAVLENTLKLYRETYREVTFVTRLSPRPLMALADPEQLKRAFVNLIDNGIEALEGPGTITVEATSDPGTRSIRVAVKDDGRGIPPELRETLFQPYVSTKKDGTGLGLSIVSSIIADHGGYVRVRPNSPRGTSFIIELPALQGDRVTA